MAVTSSGSAFSSIEHTDLCGPSVVRGAILHRAAGTIGEWLQFLFAAGAGVTPVAAGAIQHAQHERDDQREEASRSADGGRRRREGAAERPLLVEDRVERRGRHDALGERDDDRHAGAGRQEARP